MGNEDDMIGAHVETLLVLSLLLSEIMKRHH